MRKQPSVILKKILEISKLKTFVEQVLIKLQATVFQIYWRYTRVSWKFVTVVIVWLIISYYRDVFNKGEAKILKLNKK